MISEFEGRKCFSIRWDFRCTVLNLRDSENVIKVNDFELIIKKETAVSGQSLEKKGMKIILQCSLFALLFFRLLLL